MLELFLKYNLVTGCRHTMKIQDVSRLKKYGIEYIDFCRVHDLYFLLYKDYKDVYNLIKVCADKYGYTDKITNRLKFKGYYKVLERLYGNLWLRNYQKKWPRI